MPRLIELSDWMYRNPELGFKEYGAADRICSMLKDEGFDVERQVAGMETAFVGSYTGSSPGPTIALFAEYV